MINLIIFFFLYIYIENINNSIGKQYKKEMSERVNSFSQALPLSPFCPLKKEAAAAPILN